MEENKKMHPANEEAQLNEENLDAVQGGAHGDTAHNVCGYDYNN